MNGAVKVLKIFAAMANQRTRKRRPSFFGYFYRSGNEKLVVRMHEATSNMQPAFAKLGRGRSCNMQLQTTVLGVMGWHKKRREDAHALPKLARNDYMLRPLDSARSAFGVR